MDYIFTMMRVKGDFTLLAIMSMEKYDFTR
jgi:hypothetical protein